MRVFIAVEFNEKVKEDLLQIQSIVRRQSIKGNFTRRENFHLTLRFIGEIQNNELDKLIEAIDQTALQQETTMLVFNKLGQFPRGNKRIIWLGGPSAEEISGLIKDLEMSLERQGYPREGKVFVPHITLGRELILKEDFSRMELKSKIDPIDITVNKISLMQSDRPNGQLKYICLHAKEFS